MGPGLQLTSAALGKRSAPPIETPPRTTSLHSGGPTPGLARHRPSHSQPGVTTFSQACRPVPMDRPLSNRSEKSFRRYWPGPMLPPCTHLHSWAFPHIVRRPGRTVRIHAQRQREIGPVRASKALEASIINARTNVHSGWNCVGAAR